MLYKLRPSQRVLVDANIFFSQTLTDWLFFLHTYLPESFTILCTEDILAEVRYHLRRRHPTASSKTIKTKISKIRMCIDDFVEFSGSSSGVPDIYDLHVHSAALDGHIDVLLTENVKDFPSPSTYNVSTADDFFIKIVIDTQGYKEVLEIIQMQREYMRRRHKSLDLSAYLERANCPKFASLIRDLQRDHLSSTQGK